jgi:hypothetical protein
MHKERGIGKSTINGKKRLKNEVLIKKQKRSKDMGKRKTEP